MIRSLPTGSTVVAIVTVLVAELMVPDPSVTPPLVNEMVPVVPLGTLAVIVTELPKVLGPEVVTVTVGVVLLTVWMRLVDCGPLLESPLYVAVIVSAPTGKEDVLTAAVPLANIGEPRTAVPLVKVTVPVAVLGMVAVKVTD